jgi:hypothetical protein
MKKSRNTTLSFFLGFGVVSLSGSRQLLGSKQPSSRSASKSAWVIKDRHMKQVLGLTRSCGPAFNPAKLSLDSSTAAALLPSPISPSSTSAARFLASVSLSIISTYPPLPESLLSSLLEVDEVLLLSRELADQSRLEILPDSELDAAEDDAAAASATSGEVGRSSWFEGEPSPSIALAVCLTRVMYL